MCEQLHSTINGGPKNTTTPKYHQVQEGQNIHSSAISHIWHHSHRQAGLTQRKNWGYNKKSTVSVAETDFIWWSFFKLSQISIGHN